MPCSSGPELGRDAEMDRRRGRGSPPRGPCPVTRSQSLVDRISALPDDVLHRILAGVGCVRSAARTSILSRRWRGLWTGLETVTIRDLAPDAIHAALARLARPAVAALDIHVSVPRQGLQAADVDSLLAAAAGLSPVKLAVAIPARSFDVDGDDDVSLSLARLDATESLGLEVRGVFFVSPPGLVFPKLETLSLSACAMDLAAMIPRCPKLRVLRVTKQPSSVTKIEVHSASLEEFVVSTLAQSAIDIAAPALKKLTLACNMGTDGSLSVVTPMVEEISIKCWYFSMYVDLFSELWRVVFLGIRTVEGGGDAPALVLPRAHVMSLQIIMSTRFSERRFAEEMEKIPVPVVSVLELKIGSRGHVFGPLVLYLLQIYPAVQKLDIILLESRPKVEDSCFSCFRRRCLCERSNRDWRDETVSLISLTDVEIKGLRGGYHEVDFLRLIFRGAPLLQRVAVKLCAAIIPDDDWYNTVLDTFEEYPGVNCTVYL
ncbi:hypothetical protein GQ55_2G361000 [Panicum hallii var. hallii]|uniref:F-box/LRR-repeat protein 15/At3g58940/PEG3-like LRR domain-containing protein n=1 Tax=Panicum hallii var. hallii TaxID=1504633 RepID=A0A2T7EW20_9POAL|nr:hypothetical protein GQ55_2G361000 [Panicum hallii var. hallii]PUZ72034.1 hypothetical protein GQ55_2G361000 [Panicum hallii var. hallii]